MAKSDAGAPSSDLNDLVRTREKRVALLNKAIASLHDHRWYVLNPDRLDKHLRALGIFSSTEIVESLITALEEIRPENYNGQFPPELSHEDEICDAPLFAFAWTSVRFRCPMYLKFAFHGDDDSLYIVSFHQQRKRARS